jgi:hypothetical protein
MTNVRCLRAERASTGFVLTGLHIPRGLLAAPSRRQFVRVARLAGDQFAANRRASFDAERVSSALKFVVSSCGCHTRNDELVFFPVFLFRFFLLFFFARYVNCLFWNDVAT